MPAQGFGTACKACTGSSQAWVEARLDGAGRVQLAADSDSAVTRGLAAVLVRGLSGLAPAEVLAVEPAALSALVSADVFQRAICVYMHAASAQGSI